jgi:hypothetical protein
MEDVFKRLLEKGGEQSEEDHFSRGIDIGAQRDWPVRLFYPP